MSEGGHSWDCSNSHKSLKSYWFAKLFINNVWTLHHFSYHYSDFNHVETLVQRSTSSSFAFISSFLYLLKSLNTLSTLPFDSRKFIIKIFLSFSRCQSMIVVYNLQQSVHVCEEIVSKTATTINRFVFLSDFFFSFQKLLHNNKGYPFNCAERRCLLEIYL